ncbi:MAG: hypothetical protein JWO25_3495 [Alphaproteobacteria bacterium]|nr:hypothetical protein [Alphaproteobacteria bacterium]MDB5719844.1 hypothetical protein [Alphaproteobacteria bacterium]
MTFEAIDIIDAPESDTAKGVTNGILIGLAILGIIVAC